MRQVFTVVINSDEEIGIGQIGVPVMKALNLETINVEKVAQQDMQVDGACPRCGEKAIYKKNGEGEWLCYSCHTPRQ